MFPTTEPGCLSESTCNKWIAAVQGPEITQTGISDDQREMVLHLLLTFRAYSQVRDDLDRDSFYSVIGELVVLAKSCDLYERADDHLTEFLAEVAYGALPAVSRYRIPFALGL